MLSVEEQEDNRRACFVDRKSRRQIERETGYDRRTINKALGDAEPAGYKLSAARASPVLGTWHKRIDELWAQNEALPRKQRLTAKRVFELIEPEGYSGSAQSVRRYINRTHKAK
jgi:transposase